MPRRFRLGLVALIATLAVLASGCGSDEPKSSDKPSGEKARAKTDDGATAGPTKKKPSGTTIDVTFKGETVQPDGVEKKVAAGKPITLHIVADKPGELHVHSSPEQEIEYGAGTTDKRLTIDRPGVVEVESHTLEQLVVVLEVR